MRPIALMAFLLLNACGGPDATPIAVPPPVTPVVSVAITPSTLTLGTGGSLQRSAVVTGSTNGAVSWDLPGGASTGTIVSTGTANATYTAPASLGTYQVRATSVADGSKSAIATITVPTGSGFRVTGPTRVAPTTSTQFTATFNDIAVAATWTFDGAANGCTVSSSGIFTAGPTISTVTLRATDPSGRTAIAQVNVANQVILEIQAPANPTLSTADMLTFYWSVSPTGVSSEVNWSISPSSGGTTVPVDYFRGFIPSATPGVVTLTATSVADPNVKASFTATVTAAAGAPFAAPAGLPQSPRYEHAAGGVEEYNRAYNTGEIVDLTSGASTVAAYAMTTRRLPIPFPENPEIGTVLSRVLLAHATFGPIPRTRLLAPV